MNAPVEYYQKFIADPKSVLERLSAELAWIRHDKVPRSEYYINTLNVPYAYGKSAYSRSYQPQPDHSIIQGMRTELRQTFDTVFEVCFLNRYLDQSDQLGWHADDSPEMDDERPIAIVSLGVEREIWFKPNDGDNSTVERLKLENGSVCLMKAGMQDTHKHRIPKASFQCGERISLTFRGFVPQIPRPQL